MKKCENRLIFARVMDRRTEVPFLTHSVCASYASSRIEAPRYRVSAPVQGIPHKPYIARN